MSFEETDTPRSIVAGAARGGEKEGAGGLSGVTWNCVYVSAAVPVGDVEVFAAGEEAGGGAVREVYVSGVGNSSRMRHSAQHARHQDRDEN